jgi:hypothetical protein
MPAARPVVLLIAKLAGVKSPGPFPTADTSELAGWLCYRPAMKRNHVGTIGDQVRLGYTVTLNCDNCLHRADMDLAALVDENGSRYPLQGIVDRAVCRECGGRDVSVTLGFVRQPVK